MSAQPIILVIGENGQLATELRLLGMRQSHNVQTLGRAALDITDESQARRTIESLKPDVIINTAAYTAVDRAENDTEACFALNRDGAAYVAKAANDVGAQLIHLSTDYVFDGSKPDPWVETDPTNPLGVYGQSKLEGEHAVANHCSQHLILRTSWVCSAHGQNFIKTMLRLAKERPEISVVNDQWGNPTMAFDLAEAILKLIDKMNKTTQKNDLYGIYHIANSGFATWYDLAEAVFANLESLGHQRPKLIAIPTHAYPTRARRPANSRLNCNKMAQNWGIIAPDWRASCLSIVRQVVG